MKKEKPAVFLTGLLAALLLLELILRLLGFSHVRQAEERKKFIPTNDTAFVVLCLGDSFTFGMSVAPHQSYPAQLERMLQKYYPDKQMRVVNCGVGLSNTARILADLPEHISRFRPEMALILAGGANYHNHWGFMKYRRGNTVTARVYDCFQRLRIYTLARLIWDDIRVKTGSGRNDFPANERNKMSEEQNYRRQRLKKAAAEQSAQSENYREMGLFLKEVGEDEDARQFFEKAVEINPADAGNYHEIGWIYKSRARYEEARKWFMRGIAADPADSCNYNAMGWICLETGKYAEAARWFAKGLKLNPKADMNCYGIGRAGFLSGNQVLALRWFKKGLSRSRGPRTLYYEALASVYTQNGDFERAARLIKKTIRLSPEKKQHYWTLFEIYRKMNGRDETEIIRELEREYPGAKNEIWYSRLPAVAERSLEQWIAADIQAIINICREEGIAVIIQNYPEDERTQGLLREIATALSVPFVDNHAAFLDLRRRGADREVYFVPDGHCTAKGYGIMARNVFEKIKEHFSPE